MEIKQRFVLGAPLAASAAGVDIAADNISATNVTTTNLAATNITVSGSTTASGFINVRDYGATGNGTTDDTASIQSALNAAHTAGGATVYFPKGTYKISALLGIYSYTSLVGDGPGSVIQQVTAYTAGLQAGSGEHDIAIRDLNIQGTYTHVTVPNGSTAVMFYGVNTAAIAGGDMSDANFAGNRLTLQNCIIQNWGQNGCGVTAGSKIINNRFINIYSEPIIIAGDDSLIAGNYINGCGSWAIDNNASHTRIINNLIYNVATAVLDPAVGADSGGIIIANVNRTDGLRDIHVEGNTVDTSQTNGISIYAPNASPQTLAYVTVANNIVRNVWLTPTLGAPNLRGAIFVSNSGQHPDYPVHNIIVSDNIIENTYGKGIELIAVRYIDVVNNNISNITGTTANQDGIGIRVYTLPSVSNTDINIRGNTITAAASYSILVQGPGASAATRVHIVGNTISAPAGTTANIAMIEIVDTVDFTVEDNFLYATANVNDGIRIDGVSADGLVSGNYVTGTGFPLSYSATGAGAISFLGNNVSHNNTHTIFLSGGAMTNVVLKNNAGFNPIGPLTFAGGNPAVPATAVLFKNNTGYDCLVTVTAAVDAAPAGITNIALWSTIPGNGAYIWPNGIGILRSAQATFTVLVPALYSISLEYTGPNPPTWQWFGN